MPAPNATAVHIYPSPFTHESRILRETRSLSESGLFASILVVALWQEGLAEHDHIDVRREIWRVRLRTARMPGVVGKLFRFAEWYVRVLARMRGVSLTFVNCHSLSALPLGVLLCVLTGARLIYDTHELETETATFVGMRKWLGKLLERAFIGRASAVFVVSHSIGAWYRNVYGLSNVHVVRNVPERREQPVRRTTTLRAECGIPDDAIVFLYQGVMDIGRGIPLLLDTFSVAPRGVHIVFLGYGPLSEKIVEVANGSENIHYHPAVPPSDLLQYTASADVGVSLLENVSLSYYYCLPNKLFEYVTCGLPVIVSDFPEMSRFVAEHGCGWVCPVNVDDFAVLLASLTKDDIAARATRARSVATSIGWHNEEMVLMRVYEELIGLPSRGAISSPAEPGTLL